MTADDIAAHRGDWVDPISTTYRGIEVATMPPNSQGITALMALNVLSALDWPPELRLHAQIEAVKVAWSERDRCVTDPDRGLADPSVLLSGEHAEWMAGRLSPERAHRFTSTNPPGGGTVYLCAADADGMMVSYIQSNYMGFGSGIVVPEFGVALQNRGACFTLDPDHRNFAAELGRLVLESIQISQGRALVLFTSYSLLRRIHQELAPALESAGIRALMQGESPRHRLTEVFKQDTTSVLFATDSFWEGVDVAGEALENVILTKLPFSVPKEPVVEARIEAIEQAGGNAFLEYSVPQAVIKFKQGFGRLIRSKSDRGSIMIFDRRVVDKTYGKIFLSSLPECRVAQGKRERVFREVRQFFDETGQRGKGAQS
jgi:hypothetical protein